MLYSHPPSQELRQTIDDLELRRRQAAESPHEAAQRFYANCVAPEKDVMHKKLRVLAIIVFIVTGCLVGLNAFEREQAQREEDRVSAAGPGATHATETAFPVKNPIESAENARAENARPQYANQQQPQTAAGNYVPQSKFGSPGNYPAQGNFVPQGNYVDQGKYLPAPRYISPSNSGMAPSNYMPIGNQVLMPVQAVRPGEPTPPCVALPYSDPYGVVKLKRFVAR